MRVLVTGSRDWKDRDAIEQTFDAWCELHTSGLGGGIDATLVSGGCLVGADRIAEQLAEHVFGWQVERHPASWLAPCRPQCKPGHRRYGKLGGSFCPAAGNYRNQEMVDLGADVVLAFQLNGSRGTQDCMDRARAAGLRVVPYPLPIWGEHACPPP